MRGGPAGTSKVVDNRVGERRRAPISSVLPEGVEGSELWRRRCLHPWRRTEHHGSFGHLIPPVIPAGRERGAAGWFQGAMTTDTGSPCVTSSTVRSPSGRARLAVAVRVAPIARQAAAAPFGCVTTMTTIAVSDSTASAE
jgi:hypothetical protein